MSASAPQTSGSRSRTQARKKVNDDASYFGPPTSTAGPSGAKRQAVDKVEGEPRVKRKRVEPSHIPVSANGKKDAVEVESRKSLVEFHKMPTQVLHRYLINFDIVPGVYPSPLTPDDPPAPSSLTDSLSLPPRHSSPPALTPANRPRREHKDTHSRRRSSRLLEEEPRNRTPILADTAELHGVLATIVERHFREASAINGREEVDMLAAFMCAVEKYKGGKYSGS